MHKLSIIIVNWNTCKVTLQCLDSIYKYLDNIKFEIVLVDNGSHDNSIKLFRLFQKRHNNLTLVENKNNLGFSKANNIGSVKATGQYLLFLNSDTLLLDNSLEEMLSYYQKNQHQVGIIAPRLLNHDFTIQASVFPPQTLINAFKEYYLGIKNSFSAYSPNKLSQVFAVTGAAILISKKLFKKIGKWNELYFFYFEDIDLCRKIDSLKLKTTYYPNCQIIHLGGFSGKLNNQNQWKKMIKSSQLYHGYFEHTFLTILLWVPQKIKRLYDKKTN